MFANNISELLHGRPINAHSAIKNDIPNEDGVPNHYPDPLNPGMAVDNHLTITVLEKMVSSSANTTGGGGGGLVVAAGVVAAGAAAAATGVI